MSGRYDSFVTLILYSTGMHGNKKVHQEVKEPNSNKIYLKIASFKEVEEEKTHNKTILAT